MRAMPSRRGRRGADLGDWTPAELLVAAGEGDEAAWREIVGRYGRLVWSVVGGSGLDQALVADVHQTVWLRLCEHAHRIREPERLASWLATTARREAARLGRERARIQVSSEVVDVVDPDAAQPGDRLIDDEQRNELRAAMAQIDEMSRRTLQLLCVDARPSYRHVAEEIGRPLGSIGPTRARALAKIRRLLEVG